MVPPVLPRGKDVENPLQQVLDSLTDCVLLVNGAGLVVYANPAAHRLWESGQEPHTRAVVTLTGKSWWELLPRCMARPWSPSSSRPCRRRSLAKARPFILDGAVGCISAPTPPQVVASR